MNAKKLRCARSFKQSDPEQSDAAVHKQVPAAAPNRLTNSIRIFDRLPFSPTRPCLFPATYLPPWRSPASIFATGGKVSERSWTYPQIDDNHRFCDRCMTNGFKHLMGKRNHEHGSRYDHLGEAALLGKLLLISFPQMCVGYLVNEDDLFGQLIPGHFGAKPFHQHLLC